MAESQLVCMEDGHMIAQVPESSPRFYYSEEQRAAIEELIKNGDGAFKTRLEEDKVKDFLSAREIKLITSTFKEYKTDSDEEERKEAPSSTTEAESGVHSTYWPQLSDTDVPPLDLGWPSGGFFRGITQVAVHTHPPKDNGPHIKEVVRRLIQEANKVIAIVMDLLTDLHIIEDLLDAAGRRSVPVYILIDTRGVPHFLDMCSRLQLGTHQLQNIRTRALEGIGLGLSFGKLPGSICNKYMLVDGDKVMFGSFSFSWCTSRIDRNMITVMSGQVVDVFDRDFRELYAISDKLDLYKELHLNPPATVPSPTQLKDGPKRPPLPAFTSRFQVSLGDAQRGKLQVPAHKFYNPKYALAFGGVPGLTGSLQELAGSREKVLSGDAEETDPGKMRAANSERTDNLKPLPSEEVKGGSKPPRPSLKLKLKPKWPGRNSSESSPTSPGPKTLSGADGDEDAFEVTVKTPSKWKIRKSSKMGPKSESVPMVNNTQDNESIKSRRRSKRPCVQS